MIRALSALPPPEGYCGAKIETLYDCYREIPSLASFYGGEGFCCAAFAGRLTVCGAPDAQELAAFAGFLGAREIEGESLPALAGFRRAAHPLLAFTGQPHASSPPETDDLSAGYEILCDADDGFRRGSDRLEWLSDLRRRTGRGRAHVYLRDGAAVFVTAQTDRLAVIGAVACRRRQRGQGLAASLVAEVAASLAAKGLTPVTAAAGERLAGWYERIGFTRRGALALLTRADAP